SNRSWQPAPAVSYRERRQCQAIAEENPGQIQKFEAPSKKSVRGSVIAADQLIESSPDCVMPANESQIVSELIAAGSGVAGQEDAAAEKAITLNVESWASQIVGVHIELIPVPLEAGFIRGRLAKVMKPRSLESAVP